MSEQVPSTNQPESAASTAPRKRKPAKAGQNLAGAVMLLGWGAFLYLYPTAAGLHPYVRDPLAWVGFGCFLLGAITAGFGVNDFTQSGFIRNAAGGLGLGLVAYLLYLAAGRVGFATLGGGILGLLAIPFALLGMLGLSQSIPHLLNASEPPAVDNAHDRAEGHLPPSTTAASTDRRKFEHWASIIVAALGVIAGLLALTKSVIESAAP